MPAATAATPLPVPQMSFATEKPSTDFQTINFTTKSKTILNQQTNLKISLQLKEKILCLEIIGVDSGRALSQNPSLHTVTLQSIESTISYLQSKGIHLKDLRRICGMCPKILTSDIKSDLDPVFKFLSNDLTVPDRNFRKVINKCPRLLISNVGDQLKPALRFLQKLGLRDLYALAHQDSILLVSSVEKTLIPKLDFLVSLGLSEADTAAMIRRCPGLFTFSIENNLKPKFRYFDEAMKGRLEGLKEFPQYFTFSLEKRIKPRHMEVVRRGVKVALPFMLKASDEAFRELLRKGRTNG